MKRKSKAIILVPITIIIFATVLTTIVYISGKTEKKFTIPNSSSTPTPIEILPTPTSDTTPVTINQHTYIDEEAGFSIQYPTDWETEDSVELLIKSDGTRFYKPGSHPLNGIHIYYSPWALAEKEVVLSNYRLLELDTNDLEETESYVGEHKIVTVYASSEIPIYYHSIDYNGGSFIFVARGEEEEKVFLEQMLPSFTITH